MDAPGAADARERVTKWIEQTRQLFSVLPELLVTDPHVSERVSAAEKEAERLRRELEDLKRTHIEFAKRTGADASRVTFEPPVSSGLPYPRLIDLPGNQLIWDKYLTEYLKSNNLLPSPEFPLEWVVGVLLMPSEKILLHLDFTHPKVKAIFRASYDTGDVPQPGERADIRNRLRQFREKKADLESQVEHRGDMLWAKLIQVDSEPQRIRLKKQ